MAEQFLLCKVDGDLINTRHIEQIEKPSIDERKLNEETYQIILEMTTKNQHEDDTKRCTIFRGTKEECNNAYTHIQNQIALGYLLIDPNPH